MSSLYRGCRRTDSAVDLRQDQNSVVLKVWVHRPPHTTFASLKVAAGSDTDKARKALEKAEHVCLISNSLRGERTLVAEVAHTN